jgi:hypothetical protein
MSWKLYLGIFLTFTMIAMPLGIALILYHVLDMRKKSKTNDSGWNHKTFINSTDIRNSYEQRYY